MSKIALSPDPNGAGIFTIASPNSGTNRTLTLPDETGTVVTTASSPTFAGTASATKLIPTGGTATGNGMYLPATNSVAITTNGTQAVYIDSSQNVGVGTSSPVALNKLTIDNGANAYGLIIQNTGGNDAGFKLAPNGTTQFYFTANTNGNTSMESINATLFRTNNAERARIDTNGYLLVGYTTSNGAYKLQVNSQIFATSSTIATSDGRYKENIIPLSGSLVDVCALNPVQFDWKKHPVHAFDTSVPTVGFIAQEVQEVLADKPYLNSIIKRNETELPDGTKEEFLGIAEGNMIALLTKAIQELNAKVEAQAAEIAALKEVK